MLHARRGPDHVARLHDDLLAAFLLHPAGALGHDQHLPGGMGMPVRAGPRQEGDRAAVGFERLVRGEHRFHVGGAGEVVAGGDSALATAVPGNLHALGPGTPDQSQGSDRRQCRK